MLDMENLGDPLKSCVWVLELTKCKKKLVAKLLKCPNLAKSKMAAIFRSEKQKRPFLMNYLG